MIEEKLKTRILEISKKLKLSHIGSNISCLPVLMEIYEKKKPEDLVISSAGHSHLAHLVVQEYNGLASNIEELISKDIHCNREAGCGALSGSLGHGIGISIGRALANKNRRIFCIITDGSIHEGSELEALRIAYKLQIKNLEIHANFNGYTAVDPISPDYLEGIIKAIGFPVVIHRTSNGKEFSGVEGHYKTIQNDEGRNQKKNIISKQG